MMRKVAALSAAFALAGIGHAFAQGATAPATTPAPAVKAPPITAPAKPPAAVLKPAAATPAKPAAPVNACKGIVEPDCGTKTEDCSWIKGYKPKAGKDVAGYCKSKPKPKAAAAAPKVTTPPATAVKPAGAPIVTKPAGGAPTAPPAK